MEESTTRKKHITAYIKKITKIKDRFNTKTDEWIKILNKKPMTEKADTKFYDGIEEMAKLLNDFEDDIEEFFNISETESNMF